MPETQPPELLTVMIEHCMSSPHQQGTASYNRVTALTERLAKIGFTPSGFARKGYRVGVAWDTARQRVVCAFRRPWARDNAIYRPKDYADITQYADLSAAPRNASREQMAAHQKSRLDRDIEFQRRWSGNSPATG